MATVLLIGMGPTTLSALESLAVQFQILGVVRDQNPRSESVDQVRERAQELGIPVFSDVSLSAVAELVPQLQPDCVVVSSYNRILPSTLLEQCAFVNVHYAPLPRYRGRATVNWALINGNTSAAITIHAMDPELDAGNILYQQHIPICDDDTVTTLYQKLDELQREHLAETIMRFLQGYEGIPQDEKEATYACGRILADGEIDWTSSAEKIHRLVRALTTPFPGAYTYFQGRRLTVWKTEPVDCPHAYEGRIPGRVIGTSKAKGYVEVLTGDGVLKVLDVQFQGESRTAAANVIRSVRATLGMRTVDFLERIEVLEQQVARLTAILEESGAYAG